MRFNEGDPSSDVPIDWYFTKPDAKWIGFPNVFNSRNWYRGVPFWPDIGEIEGAMRPWRSGTGLSCSGDLHVSGTAAKWLHGEPSSEFIFDPPCSCPELICQDAATETGFVNERGVILPWQFPTFFNAQSQVDPAVFYTDMPVTLCPSGGPRMNLFLTDGPPTFNVLSPIDAVNIINGDFGFYKVPVTSPHLPGEMIGVES
jgi:hypothetical protein